MMIKSSGGLGTSAVVRYLTMTALVLAVVAATVLPARADDYSYQRTLDTATAASGMRALRVTGYNGNVHLYADGGNSVKVHAVLKARSQDALRDLNVTVTREGNAVVVQDVCPGTRSFFFWHFKDCDIELDVHYPGALAVNVDSENGNIVSNGTSSSLSLKNSNGNVTIDGTGGSVSVSNTNGNVRIGTAGANVQVTNTHGNVSVALSKNWRGNAIELHTSAGNVHLSVPSNFAATYSTKTTMGNIENRAAIHNGAARVTATTTFGNVIISQQ
jgi:putative adhesin